MISYPSAGMIVKLHYRKSLSEHTPQDQIGLIKRVGRGPGPRNALVMLEDGRRVVVPRGNLNKI